MKSVLFLCTHNSARSQMAEGLLRSIASGRFQASSAGTEVTRAHPLAIATMSELGIDISSQYSKTVSSFTDQAFDYVITVCDLAAEACLVFSNAKQRQLEFSGSFRRTRHRSRASNDVSRGCETRSNRALNSS
jgi:arsenate reductase